MSLLEALAAWDVAAFLRTSFYIYPLLNAAHILAIGALVTSAALMDCRVLGLGRAVPVETVIAHLRPVAIGAALVAVVTGFLLFSVQPLDYWANGVFRLKLVVIGIALLNAAAFTVLRLHEPGRLVAGRVLAAGSIAAWLGAVIAGRFVGFLE